MRDTSEADRIEAGRDSECRALAIVVPHVARPAARPLVGFMAQLIACRDRLGEFRHAGRIEAPAGAARYADTVERPPTTRELVCTA